MNNGFTPIRGGILEHLEQGRMTLMEFGVYMLLQLRADWTTGIYRGCALTIAYQLSQPEIRAQVKDVLARLKRKQYINYSPVPGKRGSYEILIHKFEPRAGRLLGTRLNAWKHGEIAEPEYEPVASDSPEARQKDSRQPPDSRPNKEKRCKEPRSEDPRTKNKRIAPDGVCERIYLAYPRHVGKAAALRAIAKALTTVQTQRNTTPQDAAEFLHSQVVKFSNSPAGQRGQYTPHPATWMNSERYNDDPNEWQEPRTVAVKGDGKLSFEERSAQELRIAKEFATRTGS